MCSMQAASIIATSIGVASTSGISVTAGRSSGSAGTVWRRSTRKRLRRVVPTWSFRSMMYCLRAMAMHRSLTDRKVDCNSRCHPDESRDPSFHQRDAARWIPAFAEMTHGARR